MPTSEQQPSTDFSVQTGRFSLSSASATRAAVQHSTPHGVVSQIHRPDVAAFLPDECVSMSEHKDEQRCVDTAVFVTVRSPLCAEDVEYLATFPRLTTLSLAKNERTGTVGLALVAEKLTHLQHLDLSECSRVDVAALAEVAKLPRLRQLSLSGCKGLHAPCFAQVAKLTQLQHLDLEACDVDAAGLSEVAKLSQLRYLNLSRCISIEAESLALFTKLANLQHLDLTRSVINAGGVEEIAEFSHLQRIDTYLCQCYDGYGGFVTISELPELKHLVRRA